MSGSFISATIVQFVIYGLIDTLSPYIPYCPTGPVFWNAATAKLIC